MNIYRVLLRGENFLVALDGKAQKLGFYATRSVRAQDSGGAERLAVDLIREDHQLGAVLNQPSDPPKIFAEEIDRVLHASGDAASGFTFFPEEPEEDA